MTQTAARTRAGSSVRSAPFVAADVGGTHARLALVQAEATGGAVGVLHFQQYVCAEHTSLAAIVRDFIRSAGAGRVEHAAIAIPGVMNGDELINANLPWRVSLSQMRQALALEDVALINDFEAVACATPYIDPAETTLLTGPPARAVQGPTLVVGPGTGFGAALRIPATAAGAPAVVLATEAGHASLAAGNTLELEILRLLLQRWPHVDNERVLSGPGLLIAYRCLCEIHRVEPRLVTPAEIAAAAQRGDDAQAVEALQVFCGVLGSLTGDLVLSCGAQAVYLAGGIPAQIKAFLLRSDFVDRYLNKGVLRSVLARVPVWLVEHGQLGLIGAAAWYLDRYAAD